LASAVRRDAARVRNLTWLKKQKKPLRHNSIRRIPISNIIFTKFFERVATANADLDAAGTVVRCLLERSTSTYSPNKDHDFVGDLTGLVEITVASYVRQTVATKAVNIDDANDRVEFDFDNIAFGSLETGQTVLSLIFYVQTGGSDATPNDDPLICRIDTATGLPATLGGGAFNVTIDAEGFIQFSQP
jgi:hypothetical protein